ncbi:MAG: AbrB/MazE/SpoVT family DNA-binding domain-containing protein [Desulfobulbaceae bacterium]|nr:AbrB/MazE/SpoVT family DNA-binding domain-containing protein [Desulfobulbaceae bacterium]
MKASIIQIGNSQGLRIPKPILKQCGFNGEVELEVHDNELIIKPVSHPRKNWGKAFQAMSLNGDDELIEFAQNQWDEEEWEWK